MSQVMEETQARSNDLTAFYSLTLFKVKFDTAETTRSKELYGNGRMQVKVQVVVAGADINGNAVHVPPEVMNSIELIHYDGGSRLQGGWVSSTEQGSYTLEMRNAGHAVAAPDADEDDSIHPQVRSFWVSSKGAGETRIAARLSWNDTTVRTNGTTLSSVHDSSVSLTAKQPVAYSIESFRWQQTRRGDEAPGNRIVNYYLGLYPQGGQQIKLVDWVSQGVRGDRTFAKGNKIRAWNTNYLQGIFVVPEEITHDVYLPYGSHPLSDVLSSLSDGILKLSSHIEKYSVRVNDRDGELTVVQALSEYSKVEVAHKIAPPFHFVAIDQYGTEHKLAIRTDFDAREFSLERG